MHNILSFDIGTRHLAYCALCHAPSKPIRITKWQVIDLMSITGTPYDEECVWVTSKSWKVGQLRSYLDSLHLSSVGTRDTLIKRIHSNLKQRGIKKITSNNLCVLASKLYAYLDTQPWMLTNDIIVLENQPCLTNPVMKSVQMLLYGYFLYKGVWLTHQQNKRLQEPLCAVHHTGGDGMGSNNTCDSSSQPKTLPRVMLTSATNKLKVCKTLLTTNDTNKEDNTTTKNKANAKSNYKQRKKDAIALTKNLLQQWKTDGNETQDVHALEEWIQKMNNSCVKEQDDLSDSFLQGLYVLEKHVSL